ncbi:MAG: DUF6599 family protein [Bacteroidales bacterium]|jgi:hypothetical protein
MKKNIILILAFCSLSCFAARAQTDEEIKVIRERNFKGAALYGFMNGGSDLYLEYGFRDLRALEIKYKGQDYSIEIYSMPTAEDAYGIYSQHTFRCITADTLGSYNCLSKFQLQAPVGEKYISIVFSSPSRDLQEGARELLNYYSASATIATDSLKTVTIPYQFKEIERPLSGKLKFMRGPLATSNVDSELENLLKNISNYKVWYLKSGNPGENKVLLLFSDINDKVVVKTRLSAITILSEGKDYIFFGF